MTPEARAALHAACFSVPRPWSAAEFDDLLSLRGSFAVDLDGGFALGRALAGEAELLTLAVGPDRRRQGLGRGLLALFEEGARARGAGTAFLEVSAENAAALSLYGSAGYAEAGRRTGYYRDPRGRAIDALLLRRGLQPPG